MTIHVTISETLFLVAGIVSTIFGILLFMGKTKWAEKKYYIGEIELTSELIGFLLFFIGIVLMLFFFIPVLGPRFSSPGMS
ncbi:MAG: hypothetical protein ACHQD9_07690 [Chitinophagales bacterium]